MISHMNNDFQRLHLYASRSQEGRRNDIADIVYSDEVRKGEGNNDIAGILHNVLSLVQDQDGNYFANHQEEKKAK